MPRRSLAAFCLAAFALALGSSGAPAASKKEAGDLARRVVEGLRAADESVESLRFAFSQTLKMTDSGLERRVEGELRYREPDLVRVDYAKPKEQHAYAKGGELWVHTPADNVVVRADWDRWRKSQRGLAHLLDFGNYSRLLETHEVSVSSYTVAGSTRTRYAVELTPEGKGEPPYRLGLVLGDDFFPVETALRLSRSVIRVELTDVQKNPRFEDGVFAFEPPAGAQVVDFPGLGR